MDHGAGWGVQVRRAGEAAQHAVADIAQIGGASPEIIVVGLVIYRDLRRQCCSPRGVGISAGFDRRESWFGQGFIIEHGKLELEHRDRIGAGAVHQRADLR